MACGWPFAVSTSPVLAVAGPRTVAPTHPFVGRSEALGTQCPSGSQPRDVSQHGVAHSSSPSVRRSAAARGVSSCPCRRTAPRSPGSRRRCPADGARRSAPLRGDQHASCRGRDGDVATPAPPPCSGTRCTPSDPRDRRTAARRVQGIVQDGGVTLASHPDGGGLPRRPDPHAVLPAWPAQMRVSSGTRPVQRSPR